MKKKNRLGKQLVSVLCVFFIIIVLLLLTGSYLFHSKSVDTLYKKRVSTLAATVASFLDGDFLRTLSETAATDEFQALREEAVENDDPSLIENYLKEKDLYTSYTKTSALLDRLRETNYIQYLYIQDLTSDAMYLLDSGESILAVGSHETNIYGFTEQLSNQRIDPVISKSSYGYRCSCAEPILDTDKNSVAVIGVDLSMNVVVNNKNRFIFVMIIFSVIILLLVAFAGSLYVRKTVSDPICELAGEAAAFGAADEDDLRSQVVEITKARNDEIGDLYNDIRKMQLGIIRYVDNMKLATEEKERLGTELDIASRIQSGVLPDSYPAFPEHQEFDIYALMKPAKSVAGDFYDFFLVDDDHLGIVIADVSGKGIPASLFMMVSKIVISSIAQRGLPPHKVLELANERICVNNDANMFVTVWLGLLTISTGHMVAANAGHEYPVLQNEDGVFELYHDKHGIVVGSMEGLHYKDYEFDMRPGQTLFLYTDGVPEATTAQNEQFGTERMVEALNRYPDADPRDLVHYMLRTVDDFDGDVPQFDDITMVAFRYKGTGSAADENASANDVSRDRPNGSEKNTEKETDL